MCPSCKESTDATTGFLNPDPFYADLEKKCWKK